MKHDGISAACDDGEHGICDGTTGDHPEQTTEFERRSVCQCDCHQRPALFAGAFAT